MTNVLTFNRGLSAVVSKELLTEVTELRNSLSKTTPWTHDATDKFNKLARIAKTAQLRGVQRALLSCAAGSARLVINPSDDVLTHTMALVQALLNHLQETVTDHRNTPMKMARPVQQLSQTLGLATSPMLAAEMFLPFVPEDTSPARPTENSSDEFISAVTLHRSTYQSSLLKLIKGGDVSQLSAMRQCLVTLEPKNPHKGYRVFFDAAIAVFDALLKTPQLDNSAKWVVSKIDPELNLIIQGSERVGDDVLSAILYVVARANHDTGARVRKLQDQYSLKSYVAEINVIDPAVIDKFLSVLVKARELWSTKQDLPYMLKITGDLSTKAAFLHNSGFSTTIAALHEVLETIHTQKIEVPAEELSLEGASALLVLEQQLREGSNVDMAKMSASRVYRLIGRTTDSGSGDQHAGSAIVHQVASEVQEDLTQLEPRLLEMLNDQNDGEPDFRAGLVKIVKILRVFGKNNPLSVAIATFEKNLKIEKTADEKARVASQYTQLSTLVELLKTSEKSAMTAAQKWLDAMTPVDTSAAPIENADIPNDKEMLEIFLEEAEGIIADLHKWIKSLKSDPSEHDTLVNARRGFHTLKGSGRMVGLSRFGDLSYIGELLLNNWITSKKLASAELLQFIEDSTNRAAKHISDFKTVGTSVVLYEDLEERAIALGGTSLSEAPQSKKTRPSQSSAPAVKVAPVEVVAVAPVAPAEPERAITMEAEPVKAEPAILEPVYQHEVADLPKPAVELSLEALPALALEPIQIAVTAELVPEHVTAPVVEVIEEPSFSMDIPAEEPSPAVSATITMEEPTPPTLMFETPDLTFDLKAAPELDLEIPVQPEIALDMEEPETSPVLPVVQGLDFDMPETLKPPKAVVPPLPPLEELIIEVPPAIAPTLSFETHSPVAVSDSVSDINDMPAIAPMTEKPVLEVAPKRKPRETPAAWQKPAERKPAAPVRKEPVATPVAPATPVQPSAPSAPATSAAPLPVTQPAKASAFKSFIGWFRRLFSRKK